MLPKAEQGTEREAGLKTEVLELIKSAHDRSAAQHIEDEVFTIKIRNARRLGAADTVLSEYGQGLLQHRMPEAALYVALGITMGDSLRTELLEQIREKADTLDRPSLVKMIPRI